MRRNNDAYFGLVCFCYDLYLLCLVYFCYNLYFAWFIFNTIFTAVFPALPFVLGPSVTTASLQHARIGSDAVMNIRNPLYRVPRISYL